MPNGEEKIPVVPTLPPPPEPPEFFPGFGRELEQLGVEQYKAQVRFTEAERRLAGATREWQLRVGIKFTPSLREIVGESAEAAIAPLQQELDLALQDVKSTRWRQEVMVTLPNYLSIPEYRIQSAEDILNYVSIDTMRDDDLTWLTNIYECMKHLSNVFQTPGLNIGLHFLDVLELPAVRISSFKGQ